MTHQVELVAPEASVQEAARRMATLGIGALPVCDGRRLLGMITDRDVAVKVVAEELNPRDVLVRDVMNSPVIYAYDDSDVKEAARAMQSNQVRRLVVLNREKKLVGVLSLGDIAVRADMELSGETLEKVSEPPLEGRSVA